MRNILLTPLQYKVIKALIKLGGASEIDKLSSELNISRSTLMSIAEVLRESGYIEVIKRRLFKVKLNDEGRRYVEIGMPERRLYKLVLTHGGSMPLKEAYGKNLTEKEVKIGLGQARKKGWIKLERKNGEIYLIAVTDAPISEDENLLMRLSVGEVITENVEEFSPLKSRNLIEVRKFFKGIIKVNDELLREVRSGEARLLVLEEKAKLTSEDLISGAWIRIKLKPYNVTARPPIIYPGRKHPYAQFLDEVREILLEMGFIEYEGYYVETEFWNFDVLFQAQDHPAREIHDSYRVCPPNLGKLPDEELVKKVKMVHENGWITGSKGWRYKWNAEIARRLVLRTQTTSVSVRFLYKHKKAPVKMFALSRNFRPDVLDATHSMEFYQCEGIVVGEKLTFANLLGFLKEFANRLGLRKVKFRPAYFPFTEPSVEGYIYHDRLGWIEALPGGMFRPEVLIPLGIKHTVLAWGIGIDRLAMAVMGIDDIRELFTKDLGKLRTFKWVSIRAYS